jgi:hypothetical protein
LVEHGDIDYLVFECLAERTIALAQQVRLQNPEDGYDPLLVERMEAVLPACHARGIRIITNMGAANPLAAQAKVLAIARRHGLRGLTVATVTGDDVLSLVRNCDAPLVESGRTVAELGERVVAANAYLGAEPMVAALSGGADIVVTGRVADPSLALAAQMHAFEWAADDWPRLGRGTVVGHLVECAGQITGGYFAEPGKKEVPDLARLGFPILEVDEDGDATVTKVAGSGGCVTVQTCTEQILYEVHRPDQYMTPDTVADFSKVSFDDLGHDRVRVTGGTGAPRPEQLKVSVGYTDGFRGEGQISYTGPGAIRRGRLAAQIVVDRLALTGTLLEEIRCDLIGVDAISGPETRQDGRSPFAAEDGDLPTDPTEVRVRVAARAATLDHARRVGREVEALLTNGPAGGGGAWKTTKATVAVESTFVPRSRVTPAVRYEVV